MLQRKYNTLLNLMTVLKYICAFLGIQVCKGPLTKVPLCMSLCVEDDLLDLLPHAKSALFLATLPCPFLGLRETLNHPSVEWTGTGVGWLTPVPEVPGSSSAGAPFAVSLSKSHFHSSCGYGQKLIDSVNIKKKKIMKK